MKFLIASDIHGSAKYCRLLSEAVKREGADKLILLGDILYHGPRNPLPEGYFPQEVIKILSRLKDKIICIRGNCDAVIDQMVLPFPIPGNALLFVDGVNIYISHGHKETPPLCNGDVYITGHTHVPLNAIEDGYYHLNPGSVSLPKEDSKRGYILYENRTFTFKTLEGEVYDSLSLDEPQTENTQSEAEVEEPSTEDTQSEDTQAEVALTDDTQSEETQAEETATEDTQPEDTQAEETVTDGTQPEVEVEETTTEEVQSEETEAEEQSTKDTQPKVEVEETVTEGTQPEVEVEETTTEEVQSEETEAEEQSTEDTQPETTVEETLTEDNQAEETKVEETATEGIQPEETQVDKTQNTAGVRKSPIILRKTIKKRR